MNLKRGVTPKNAHRMIRVRMSSSKRGNMYKKEIARLLADKSILIPSPLGPIVKPRDREQIKVHYDMFKVNEYCKRTGKALKELTPEEMLTFRVIAKVLKPTQRL